MPISADHIRSFCPVNKEKVEGCLDGLFRSMKIASKQGIHRVLLHGDSLVEEMNYVEKREFLKQVREKFAFGEDDFRIETDATGEKWLAWD